jgi:CRP/FNR family transcriptional regulator
MICHNTKCPFITESAGNGRSRPLSNNCLVSDSVKEVSFSKGDFLFSQDQPSCCVYVLTDGVAKIVSVTPDGHEQIVGFASPEKLMVGLRSLSNENYADSAVAETRITACKIRKRSLLSAVTTDPKVAFRLIDALNAQLAMSRAMIRAGERHGAAAKIAAFLLLLIPTDKHDDRRHVLPVSRSEIADILGLSEETVCRQMAKMRRRGILYAPRGAIEVHDWDKLNAIANGTPSASECAA